MAGNGKWEWLLRRASRICAGLNYIHGASSGLLLSLLLSKRSSLATAVSNLAIYVFPSFFFCSFTLICVPFHGMPRKHDVH